MRRLQSDLVTALARPNRVVRARIRRLGAEQSYRRRGPEYGRPRTLQRPEKASFGNVYLVALFVGYLAGVFYIVHEACAPAAVASAAETTITSTRPMMFLGFVSAWVGDLWGRM